VTVGRQGGEPNITVIYDGEIIRGMTWKKTLRKKSQQSLGRVQAVLAATRGIGGSVQAARGCLPEHAEHLARGG
jgi:hypothetical protein